MRLTAFTAEKAEENSRKLFVHNSKFNINTNVYKSSVLIVRLLTIVS